MINKNSVTSPSGAGHNTWALEQSCSEGNAVMPKGFCSRVPLLSSSVTKEVTTNHTKVFPGASTWISP